MKRLFKVKNLILNAHEARVSPLDGMTTGSHQGGLMVAMTFLNVKRGHLSNKRELPMHKIHASFSRTTHFSN